MLSQMAQRVTQNKHMEFSILSCQNAQPSPTPIWRSDLPES